MSMLKRNTLFYYWIAKPEYNENIFIKVCYKKQRQENVSVFKFKFKQWTGNILLGGVLVN